MRLSFLWESLSEELINDSPFHSDLDSLTAPVWILDLRMQENLNSSLWSYLNTLQNFSEKHDHDKEPLLTRLESSAEQTDSEVRNVFDRLSNQGAVILTLPTFQSYLPRISESLVESLVDLIFLSGQDDLKSEPESFLREFKKMKSCRVFLFATCLKF